MPRTTTATLPQITISWLKKQGYFKYKTPPTLNGINFTTTNCYFGNERFWFLCKCGNRVGVLYESANGFRCRKCLNLAYPSQNIRKSIRNDVMLSALDNLIKASELQKEIKTPFYLGQPTRKQKKVELLYHNFLKISQIF